MLCVCPRPPPGTVTPLVPSPNGVSWIAFKLRATWPPSQETGALVRPQPEHSLLFRSPPHQDQGAGHDGYDAHDRVEPRETEVDERPEAMDYEPDSEQEHAEVPCELHEVESPSERATSRQLAGAQAQLLSSRFLKKGVSRDASVPYLGAT